MIIPEYSLILPILEWSDFDLELFKDYNTTKLIIVNKDGSSIKRTLIGKKGGSINVYCGSCLDKVFGISSLPTSTRDNIARRVIRLKQVFSSKKNAKNPKDLFDLKLWKKFINEELSKIFKTILNIELNKSQLPIFRKCLYRLVKKNIISRDPDQEVYW
jgi:hypothetical protein